VITWFYAVLRFTGVDIFAVNRVNEDMDLAGFANFRPVILIYPKSFKLNLTDLPVKSG
jgi:hypothetical protein